MEQIIDKKYTVGQVSPALDKNVLVEWISVHRAADGWGELKTNQASRKENDKEVFL